MLHRHFQNTASVSCTSVQTRLPSASCLFFPLTLKKSPFSLGRHSSAATGSRKSLTLCRLYLVPSFNLYKYSVPHLFIYCYSSPLLPFNCSALPGHGNRMVKEQQSGTRRGKKWPENKFAVFTAAPYYLSLFANHRRAIWRRTKSCDLFIPLLLVNVAAAKDASEHQNHQDLPHYSSQGS